MKLVNCVFPKGACKNLRKVNVVGGGMWTKANSILPSLSIDPLINLVIFSIHGIIVFLQH